MIFVREASSKASQVKSDLPFVYMLCVQRTLMFRIRFRFAGPSRPARHTPHTRPEAGTYITPYRITDTCNKPLGPTHIGERADSLRPAVQHDARAGKSIRSCALQCRQRIPPKTMSLLRACVDFLPHFLARFVAKCRSAQYNCILIL